MREGNAKKYAWKMCDECGKISRQSRMFKNKNYCYSCYRKHTTNMSPVGENFNPSAAKSLEQALNKIRTVKSYVSTKGWGMRCYINMSVPSILVGRRVRLVLVEDKEK